jgi:hypothetical protein
VADASATAIPGNQMRFGEMLLTAASSEVEIDRFRWWMPGSGNRTVETPLTFRGCVKSALVLGFLASQS